MQDLMSFRGVEYLRSEFDPHMRPAMQKRLMRRRIKEQASDDYQKFKSAPTSMQLRIRPDVYAACTAPRGIITAIITSVVVNLIAKAVTNAIIDHWRKQHATG